jgi:hypothetical protein
MTEKEILQKKNSLRRATTPDQHDAAAALRARECEDGMWNAAPFQQSIQ